MQATTTRLGRRQLLAVAVAAAAPISHTPAAVQTLTAPRRGIPAELIDLLVAWWHDWRHLAFIVATVDLEGRADDLAVAATERLDRDGAMIAAWTGVRLD